MDAFLPLAAKSVVITGGTLLLLKLLQHRSAADRSWIAHLGLVALLMVPLAYIALPSLDVPGPSFLAGEAPAQASVTTVTASAPEVAAEATPFRQIAPVSATVFEIDWARAAYAVPALVLLLLTLIAVGRLIGLKARAQVLVDSHWLSALARAQRRMGFKSGTALLTSDELRSPVSWGLVRPVIVLSPDAADARGEAEAIIAHELAHVARFDWAKLLLARIAVAIFWFNPLVWLLAREAHQLREETADDAVLASDIEDTEYANLLVGIARHECRGLLLGAHGVAPSRNSLARRVRRVLDGALARAPGGWRWGSAAAFFAAGMAVPVAALNFVPTVPRDALADARVQTAMSAGEARPPQLAANQTGDALAGEPGYYAPDIDIDRGESVAEAAARASREARAAGDRARAAGDRARAAGDRARAAGDRIRSEVDELIGARIHGVTPAYVEAMRAAAAELANARVDELTGMKIHEVTPGFISELRALGYRELDSDALVGAKLQGVTVGYARSIARAGYRGITVEELTQLKMFGVTPEFIADLRRSGHRGLSAEQLVEARLMGFPPPD